MHHSIPLPRGWNRRTKAAILKILALSHYAFTAMVARAANERSWQVSFSWPIHNVFLIPVLS